MSARFLLLLVTILAPVSTAAAETLAVGLTLRPATFCGAKGCLRIVDGRYHPATIAQAAPAYRDRQMCREGFVHLATGWAEGRAASRQAVHRARRCRALGLAPVIVRG